MYELGNYFSSIGDYDKAIINYDILIEGHKTVSFMQEQLNKGFLYNLGKSNSDSILRNLVIELKNNPISASFKDSKRNSS